MTEKADDGNVLVDNQDDDWEWRRRIRANPATAKIYRIAVFVLGLLVVAGGIVALPAPGPGWVIIFLGLGIWATEFEWAQRVLEWVKAKVKAWELWLRGKPWWVSVIFGLLTLALVLAIFWAMFSFSGVPGFLPDAVENRLHQVPGLAP